MKITDRIQELINTQINHELASSYLYLSMSAHFEQHDLPGFAHWMRKQFAEEQEHALKFVDYVHSREGTVVLKEIPAPQTSWSSPLEAMQATYAHEQKVTDLIHSLLNAAIEEKDHATVSFLKWFVDEQVEEEASAKAILEKLKMVGDNKASLLMIDRELGSRE